MTVPSLVTATCVSAPPNPVPTRQGTGAEEDCRRKRVGCPDVYATARAAGPHPGPAVRAWTGLRTAGSTNAVMDANDAAAAASLTPPRVRGEVCTFGSSRLCGGLPG